MWGAVRGGRRRSGWRPKFCSFFPSEVFPWHCGGICAFCIIKNVSTTHEFGVLWTFCEAPGRLLEAAAVSQDVQRAQMCVFAWFSQKVGQERKKNARNFGGPGQGSWARGVKERDVQGRGIRGTGRGSREGGAGLQRLKNVCIFGWVGGEGWEDRRGGREDTHVTPSQIWITPTNQHTRSSWPQ